MINRKIVLYIIFLGIIVGGAPYFTGMLVETKFQDVVKVISESDTMPVVVEVTEYKRGWRKSFAKTRVTFLLNDQVNKKNEYSIILEHEIRHGPFVQLKDDNYRDWHFARALIHSKLMVNDEAKKILVEEIGHTELFNINSEMTIDGIVRVNLEGQPLKLKEHEGTERVAWKGFNGQWELSSDLKHLKGKMIIPGLDIDLNGTHYYAGDLLYQTELSKSPQGLWPGKFLANMDKLSIENQADKYLLQIDGITSGGMMTVEGGMADFSGTLRIEKLVVDNKEYGPIDYSTALKHIDARVVKTILTLSHKLKAQGQSHAANNLMALLPDVLKTRPEFFLDPLQIHTQQGDIKAALSVAVGGPQAADVNRLNDIILSIVAKANLILPKVILRDLLTSQYMKSAIVANEAAKKATPDANQQLPKVLTDEELAQEVSQKVSDAIAKWIKDYIIVEQGNNYVSIVDFEQGKLNVNGHPMDLGQSKAMMGPATTR